MMKNNWIRTNLRPPTHQNYIHTSTHKTTIVPTTKTKKILLDQRFFYRIAKHKSQPTTPEITNVSQKNYKTIIIVAPHPDDEILCCSNVISKILDRGDHVKIIFITDGDARSDINVWDSREYSLERRKESLLAAKRLGLNSSDLIFLGYPDGYLHKLKETSSITSLYTGRNRTPEGTYAPYSPYTKASLRANLSKILQQYHPTKIYIPNSTLDTHPDHQVAGILTKEALAHLGMTPEIYQYVVHNENLENQSIYQEFDTHKLSLIQVFKSQFHTPAHEAFMEKFAKIPEQFQ